MQARGGPTTRGVSAVAPLVRSTTGERQRRGDGWTTRPALIGGVDAGPVVGAPAASTGSAPDR